MADEYIRREDVIEILRQKQRDICPMGRCGHGYVYGRDRDEYDAIEADIDAVQSVPAIGAVEVVRCKDCEHNRCPNCGADIRGKDNG